MKVIRNHAMLKRMTKQDDSYVNASPGERVAVVWEITAELWALKDKEYVERRLQRHVAGLTKTQG